MLLNKISYQKIINFRWSDTIKVQCQNCRKKRGGTAMKRYDENFKIEALKLSDEIGVKKACEQLNVNYGRFIFSC